MLQWFSFSSCVSLSLESANITYLMILIDKVIGFVRVRASDNCHYIECMERKKGGFGAILKIDPMLRHRRYATT